MRREVWFQRLFFGVHSYASILAFAAFLLHLGAARYHWGKSHE